MRPEMPATGPSGSSGSAGRPEPAAPLEHVDHIAEAERLERTAARYPEDAEHLLLQAGAHYELAGAREAASALYDRLLSPSAAVPPENPQLVKALKAAHLWEYGHEAEARAVIDGVRLANPTDPAPWVIVAEALEAHDELDAAHDTFTQALTLLASPQPATTGDGVARALETPGSADAQDAAAPQAPPAETRPLIFGRHRVRRMLGADHDDWDALADSLNTTGVPLDDLHDPKRVWALGSDNPAELRAEISRLRAELGAYRAALSRPFPVAVLHWPEAELRELVTAYPDLASEFPSHAEHLATIETSLRELAASGTPNLGIVSATVPSYEAFAASESSTPSDTSLLPQYATTLAARGLATAWPPAPDDPCWCGSTRTYGECHGG
jgi:SEC-C motif